MIKGIEIDLDDPVTLKAAGLWGTIAQLEILQEECGEAIELLVIALSKTIAKTSRFKRNRITKGEIAEEIADVLVCMKSVIPALNIADEVVQFMECKTERLKLRIESIEKGGIT